MLERFTRTRLLLLTLATGSMSFAPAGLAQDTSGIRGQLLNRTSRTPIPEATVTVAGTTGALNVRSDRNGHFLWAPLRAGTQTIRARAIGYVPGEWTVTLAAGETLSVVIELEEVPVALPEIVVEGTRNRANLEATGFAVRRARGHGVFLAREDIQKKQATKLSDIVRDIPGVREVCGSGNCVIRMTRNQDCRPNFFVDGLPANNAIPTDFALTGVVGIEVYRTESETPAEFLRGMNVCGAIVIWTTRGR